MARTVQLKLMVSPEEMEQIRKSAGEQSVSHWIRRQILNPYAKFVIPPETRVRIIDNPSQSKGEPQPETDFPVAVFPEQVETAQAILAGEPLPTEVDENGEPVVLEAPKPKRAVKTCIHGERKGHNCWQCGGLAEIQP
jgi:hypothetical protein